MLYIPLALQIRLNYDFGIFICASAGSASTV